MRFIHTADLHIGNSLHELDRIDEFRSFFAWFKDLIVSQKAEALIIAGDVFDTINPSNEARKTFYEFLASLLATDCKNIIIVGGNHDSGLMLDTQSELLKALNIQIVGSLANHSIEDIVYELKDPDGKPLAICAAVPFAREPELREYADSSDEKFATASNKALYTKVCQKALELRGKREIPVIGTGHLYAANLEGRLNDSNQNIESLKGHGIRDIVGNLGNVSPDAFPTEFDYIALGHIHYTTMVNKNPRIRYSGSPFVLGFDEAEMPHYVLSVDLEPEKEPIVEKIEVPQTVHFKRIKGSIDEITNALAELNLTGFETPLYLEICYKPEIGVNIHERLLDIEKDAKFVIISWKAITEGIKSEFTWEAQGIDEVNQLSDEEIFKRLILSKTGYSEESDEAKILFEEYLPLFQEVVESINNEEVEE